MIEFIFYAACLIGLLVAWLSSEAANYYNRQAHYRRWAIFYSEYPMAKQLAIQAEIGAAEEWLAIQSDCEARELLALAA